MYSLYPQVRQATLDKVGGMKRADVQTSPIAAHFAEKKWREHDGLLVTRVVVQNVSFDSETHAMLRAQSMGMTSEQYATHAERMHMADALRANKNTHVVLGDTDVMVGTGTTRKRGRGAD